MIGRLHATCVVRTMQRQISEVEWGGGMNGELITGDERLLGPVRDLILEIEAPAILLAPLEGGRSAGEIVHQRLVEQVLSAAEAELLHAVIEIAASSDMAVAERSALLNRLNIKRPSLYQRMKRLIHAGALREHKIATPRRGPNPRVFVFDAQVLEAEGFTLGEQTTMSVEPDPSETDAELVFDEDDLFRNRGLPTPRDMPVKGDQLAIFALPALLPSFQARNPNYIEMPVRYGNQYLQAVVRATSGIRMARVRDTRVLAAVITIAFDRIHHQGLPATNPWVMRVSEILDVMHSDSGREEEGGTSGGSQKRWILDVLKRWQGTQFEIQHITPKMRAYYGDLVSTEESFRFINRLHVISWVGMKGKTPEDVCIYLDDLLVRRMRSEQFAYTLTLQTSMMSEPNDLAYRLSLWCRRSIKRTTEPHQYSIEFLREQADPTTQQKAFGRALRALYEERVSMDTNIMSLHGYCFRQLPGARAYAIWADPHDKLLGTKSYANRKLSQGEGPIPDDDI